MSTGISNAILGWCNLCAGLYHEVSFSLHLCAPTLQAMPSTVDEYRAYVAEQARLELEAEREREAEEGELMASEDLDVPVVVRIECTLCSSVSSIKKCFHVNF